MALITCVISELARQAIQPLSTATRLFCTKHQIPPPLTMETASYRIDSNYPVLLGERARSRATSSHCSSYLPSSEEGLVDFSKGVSSYSQERLTVLGDRYTRSGDSGTFADSEFDGWRGGFAWLESVHGLRVKPDNSSQFGIKPGYS